MLIIKFGSIGLGVLLIFLNAYFGEKIYKKSRTIFAKNAILFLRVAIGIFGLGILITATQGQFYTKVFIQVWIILFLIPFFAFVLRILSLLLFRRMMVFFEREGSNDDTNV